MSVLRRSLVHPIASHVNFFVSPRRILNRLSVPPLALLLLVGFTQVSVCQDANAKGVPAYGSYEQGQIDTVNLSNGNVLVDIPLTSIPQRGRLKLEPHVYLNNKLWTTYVYFDGQHDRGAWTTTNQGAVIDYAGFLYGGYQLHEQCVPPTTPPLRESNGTLHSLINPGQTTCTSSNVFYTEDGSDIKATYLELTDKNGIRYSSSNAGPYHVTDPDGNTLSYGADGFLTDSIGRRIPSVPTVDFGTGTLTYGARTSTDGCTGPGTITLATSWTIPGPNNQDVTYKFCYISVALSTAFNYSWTDAGSTGQQPLPVAEYSMSQGGAPMIPFTPAPPATLLQSIVLPNGKAWSFKYGSSPGDTPGSNYGDLIQITMPTGGTISYTYKNVVMCSRSLTYPYADSSPSRVITSKTVDAADGSDPQVWHYSWPHDGVPCVVAGTQPEFINVIVNDPAGNDTVHWFSETDVNPLNAINYIDTVPAGKETKTQFFSGSYQGGQLLKTTSTSYWTIANGGNPVNGATFPKKVTVTLPSGLVSSTEYDYDTNFQVPFGNQLVNASYGNKIAQREYGFGAGTSGPLLSETITQYKAFEDPRYLAANFLNLVSSVTTNNDHGIQAAKSSFGFDETATVAGTNGTSVSPANTVLGHQTSSTRYTAATSSSTTSSVFNADGMLYESMDALQTVSHFEYGCNGSQVSSITAAYGSSQVTPQHTNYTRDCNTGIVTLVASPNDVAQGRTGTQSSIDSMGRVTSISYPDGGGVSIDFHGDSFPMTVTTTTDASPNPPLIKTSVYDGLGRVSHTTLNSAGSVKTDTTYDYMGRVKTVTNGYQSTSDPTYGLTQYSYDPLGRITVVSLADGSKTEYCYDGIADSHSQQSNCHSRLGNTSGEWQDVSDANHLDRQLVLGAHNEVLSVIEVGDGTRGSFPETDYGYDTLGNLVSISQLGIQASSCSPSPCQSPTDSPRQRAYTYDQLSRLITSQTPESGYICYGTWSNGICANGYDANGNMISRTDARGIETHFTYDALNRPTTKYFATPLRYPEIEDIVANSPTTMWTYDNGTVLGGSQLQQIDGSPVGNFIGRLTSEQISYPNSGITLRRQVGGYDEVGRLLSEQQCSPICSAIIQITYDHSGKSTSSTNGSDNMGILFDSAYDGGGKLTSLSSSWDDSTHPGMLFGPLSSGAQQYSAAGSLANVGYGFRLGLPDPLITATRTYDNRLRVSTEIDAISADSIPASATIQFTGPDGHAPGVGHPCLLCAPTPDAGIITIDIGAGSFDVSIAYSGESQSDLAGEVASALNAADTLGNPPLVRAYASGAEVNLVSLVSGASGRYPLVVTISNPDDYGDPETNTTLTGDMQISQSTAYGYSISKPDGTSGYAANGNVVAMADTVMGTWVYAYDDRNQLISANGSGKHLCWTYDSFGNRLREASSDTVVLTGSCPVGDGVNVFSFDTEYDVTNQIKPGWMPNPSGSYYPYIPTYDNSGNMTADTTNNYVYDADGRVCAVQSQVTGTWTGYLYDAEGRRVAKGVGDAGCNTVDVNTMYVFAPNSQTENSVSNGIATWRKTDVYASGMLFATYDSSGLSFHLRDWLGTSRVDVNAGDASQLQRCPSLPFGEALPCSGSTLSSLGNFAGSDYDSESGLDYFPARFLAPSTGRWISPDTFGGSLANPQTLNRYVYVGNNPLRFVDPMGRCDTSSQDTDHGTTKTAATFVCTATVTSDVSGTVVSNLNSLVCTCQSGMASAPSVDTLPAPLPDPNVMTTTDGSMINAVFHDSANVWNAANSVAGTLTGVASWYAASATIATGIVTAPAVGSAALNYSGMLGPTATRIFYSSLGAMGAMQVAEEQGGFTLEMSPLGEFANWVQGNLNQLPLGMGQNPLTGAFWNGLSQAFADGAEGPVTYLVGPRGYGTVWWNTEMPTLIQNGNQITEIPVH